MNTHNYFFKSLKKINLFITNLLEKNLNKLNSNYFSNIKSYISSSNKALVGLVLIVISFSTYVSIPHVYDKTDIGEELKNQLINKYNLNFRFSKNFEYSFFPRPHFTIKDAIIFDNRIEISNIKNLKVYVSLNNLFSLKKIGVSGVVLEKANFNLDKKNYNFFVNLLENNYSERYLKIKDSNIFYQDNDNEILFINKIINMKYYYDVNDLQNVLKAKNEIFNLPYKINFRNDKINKKIYSTVNLDFFKIQINNEVDYSTNSKNGKITSFYKKNKTYLTYRLNKNIFSFKLFDKIVKSKFIYSGEINTKPFDANINGNIHNITLSNFFSVNSILVNLFKTELLNNKNLTIDINILSKKINSNEKLRNAILQFKIKDGLIDIDKTKFNWSDDVKFEILESLLYVNNNNLILDGKLIIKIDNYHDIYQLLQTSKNHRLEIKEIEFDFNYNFDQKIFYLENIIVDDKKNEDINKIFKKVIIRDNELQNKIYFKNLLNKAFKIYVG